MEQARRRAGAGQGAQTADRALALLELVAAAEGPLTLAELGARAGLNRAATYRLVQSLLRRALLARTPDGRRYAIGSGLVALAATVLRKVRVDEVARPFMERIARATSETVSLHIRHLRQRVCVATVESGLPVRRVVPLGETLPLFAGTTGKAIVAFLPEAEREEALAAAAAEGHDPKRIRRQLAAVRERGLLIAVGDRTPGVGGISVPVFSAAGIAAALTVSGPAERFDAEAMAAGAPEVLRRCGELSRELGHAGPLPGLDAADA